MINYIELENWKAHGLTTLSFSNGTNILIGQMGAGKSSILDAISFGFFGTFPAIKNRRVKVEDLIRNKPEQKRSARVKLGFEVDGIPYTVERSISLDETAKATFKKNDVYVQSQPQRVTEEVEKVLKVDYDLFARAIYAEQNRLDYFLELGASDRKKQIDNLLGLDRFAAAQENAGSLINRIKEMIADSEKLAKGFDLKKLREQHIQMKEELSKLEKEKVATEEALRVLKAAETQMGTELLALKKLYEKKIQLEKETGELESKVGILEKEIGAVDGKTLPSVEELEKQINFTNTSISELKKKRTEHLSLLQSTQGNIGKLEKELQDIEKNKKEKRLAEEKMKGRSESTVKVQLDGITKELESMEKEYAHSAVLKQEAEKSLDELRRHISKCPICDSELSEHKHAELVKSRQEVIKNSSSKITTLGASRTQKREQVAKLTAELNSLTVTLERIKSYGDLEANGERASKELARLSDQIKTLTSAASSVEESVTKGSENLAKLKASRENVERITKQVADRDRYSATLELRKKEMKGLVVDNAKIEALQKRHTEASSQISGKSALLFSSVNAIGEKTVQIKDKEGEIARIDAMYAELNQKKGTIDDLSRFKNALEETQGALRSHLVSAINQIMEGMWPRLYPYGDYTGIMLDANESDYALQLQSLRDGEPAWENVNSIASGGERSIACMALRIAFSLVLVPNLKWLILDEPTHNIDQQGLSKLVTMLNETLPELVGQVFIITHDEQLKRVSNARIYMLSREKAEHGATVAQEL